MTPAAARIQTIVTSHNPSSLPVPIKQNGVWCRFPVTKEQYLAPNGLNSLQVADDGENIQIHLNGALLYSTRFLDARLQDATGTGIRVVGGNVVLRSFEAHPRVIPVPVQAAPENVATSPEPSVISAASTLMSEAAGAQVAAAFDDLARAIRDGQMKSMEDMAREMLRPMLQEWLDDNLPTLVERLVREEIERIARGPRR